MRGNRDNRTRGRGRGRGREHDNKRALFNKLIKDPDATMAKKYQSFRFLEGMDTFGSDKQKLISILVDERSHGAKCLKDIVSFVEDSKDIEDLVIPLLRHGINDEMSKPFYRGLRDRYLNMIFRVPMLLDFIDSGDIASSLSNDSAELLCKFLLHITKAFGDARSSTPVRSIAKKLRERGGVNSASTLCMVLIVEDVATPLDISEPHTKKLKEKDPVCWVTDRVPPGGRHDNDHMNYRDIAILPTAEELRCQNRPFLPLSNDSNAVIDDPVARLLDSNFRLLREDSVSSMRENIAERKWPWKNARVIDLNLKDSNSLSFIVQVDPPEREIVDWQRAKVLLHGSVIAFLDNEKRLVRTGTITIRQEDMLENKRGPCFGCEFDGTASFDASVQEMAVNKTCNDQYGSLLCSGNEKGAQKFLRSMATFELIEISKSFFAYQSVLKAIQQTDQIPFQQELISMTSTPGPLDYMPELLVFPDDHNFRSHSVSLLELSPSDISSNTSLDESQANSMVHALSSKVALIQGPPGTGKTFIGGLLAQLVLLNTQETILCVCYTNHALDQFLEHILDFGENRVVRLGGRSRSDRIGSYQLNSLARTKAQQDGSTSSRIRQVDAQLHQKRESIQLEIETLEEPVSWTSPNGGMKWALSTFFADQFVYVCAEFNENQGFHVVGPKGKKLPPDYLWQTWCQGREFPSFLLAHVEFSNEMEEFWSMQLQERTGFIHQVKHHVYHSTRTKLHELVNEFRDLQRERKALSQEKDLQILRDARVVGATTNGAARYKDLLAEVSPKVLIVEEAGEVLEAHVLSSLSPEMKHVILIGDHLQLRPKLETHSLTTVSGCGYDLDKSLFERLILGGLPSSSLAVQHRMRPSISRIIREQTYPKLLDHRSVAEFPDVRGVSHNVVFIKHEEQEDGELGAHDQIRSTTTKSNLHEAELCVEIARFLLFQGYAKDQIVILTPYLGQLHKIIGEMKRNLKDVEAYISEQDLEKFEGEEYNDLLEKKSTDRAGSIRCSSVDNYQGEESDIVIASLVRSNEKGSIGFLKEPQRVNVLLSRARQGMFLVGNVASLKLGGKSTWEPIFRMLQEKGQILDGFPTTCQLHPKDEPVLLRSKDDFRRCRPNGGCCRPCKFRLQCGHACQMMCHPVDQSHVYAQSHCYEPCARVPEECTRGHRCTKLCKDHCGECSYNVGPIQLPCGHPAASIRCHDARNKEALQKFGETCKHSVKFCFENCGHTFETACGNANSRHPKCPGLCEKRLDCGHPCQKRCGSCESGHDCKQTCDRVLFCGHQCNRNCHLPDGCPPCEKSKCDAVCIHSKCPMGCSEPCASCVEECDWECEHQGKCSLVCGAPCNRLPCNERCSKALDCGHQCPSICGEICPSASFCVECGNDEVKCRVVDMILFQEYKDLDLDSDPIVMLPCQHFFSVSTLDALVGIGQVYQQSGDKFVGTHPLKESDISEKAKQCPDCRATINSIHRYSRITKFSALRGLERKHLMKVDEALKAFSQCEPRKRSTNGLLKVLRSIKASPMKKVFDACQGISASEIPSPPSLPLINCLQLLGQTYAAKVQDPASKLISKSVGYFEEAVQTAALNQSHRSGASVRVCMARSLVHWTENSPELKETLMGHLKWVQEQGNVIAADLVEQSKELMAAVSSMEKERVKEVVRAMNEISGYNYGGGANSHWYECPNGHPYFIGECGGAMQQSRCIECGAPVGGGNHTLTSGNRSWTGFRDAMN